MYLNCHSQYSFRYGTMSPRELLIEAQQSGIHCLALTDINSTAASLNFIRLAQEYGIRPVVGIDFRNGVQQQFVGLAQNNEGFQELNTFLSHQLQQGKPIPDRAPFFENVQVIYPFHSYKGHRLRDNESLGVSPTDLNRLSFSPWRFRPEKLVALHSVTFRNKRDFNAHRLLRAIDKNTLLSKLSSAEEGQPWETMLPPKMLRHYYKDFPELLNNADRILERCQIYFEIGVSKNQKTYTGSEQEDFEMLRQLCLDGLPYRYAQPEDKVYERIERELEIIRKMGFLSYFLISWDIVRYAQSKGYFYVGRGSGANSIVAYLLRITDVDPIELDLYFERFINLYRTSPPDFDIDFSWKDRDDVTRYIFERFPNTALLGTYNTFQYKAVVRELGKVFGLPKNEIDVLSEGKRNGNRLDKMSGLVLKYGQLIEGFPSHLGIHAGGIIISERPVNYYTTTYMPPKGFPTTQFDMLVAEDVGLHKFDILSQRGLGKIKECLEVIQYNKPEEPAFDIHDMPRFKKDPKIKALLREGKTIGCFYVESPAMRMLLKKLKVDDYLGLVAASSIIRPGVAKSGMMREYILRFRNPERRKEAHPVMLDIMPETFGVMVYQEDVIKVAHYFAGLSLAEADVLRRGMSGKFRSRSEFKKVGDSFFNNCKKKGYNDKLINEIWKQIESFAGYAFSKGHSASYAVESYQSLFLKAYYPLEYMVATINNFGGFYRTDLYIHEARMHGGDIASPCVNHSSYMTMIEGKTIYLGFCLINSLDQKVAEALVRNRDHRGRYMSLDDFVDRIAIGLEQLCLLIRSDAFRFTGQPKKELLWRAHFLLGDQVKEVAQVSLFQTKKKQWSIPSLDNETGEEAFNQMELFGFSLGSSFDLLAQGKQFSYLCVEDLPSHLNKTVTIFGELVTVKQSRTTTGKIMYFGTFLDETGEFFDTTHFPNVATRYPFRGRGVYRITGKVVEEFGFYSLEVSAMTKEAIMEDPRYKETVREKENIPVENRTQSLA